MSQSESKKFLKKKLFNLIQDKPGFLYNEVLGIWEKIDTTTQDLIKKVENVSKMEGPAGPKGDNGLEGPQGKEGPIGKDGNSIVGPQGPAGPKGEDGKSIIGPKGDNGKDGSPDTPKQIASKLNTLEEAIDVSVIKGAVSIKDIKDYPSKLEKLSKRIDTSDLRWHGGGATKFTQLSDVPQTYTGGAGKAVYVNGTEDGLIFQTAVSSDEKVKYDVNDPTAGYVADKIIAGTGISVAEGTGANENKLVITNSQDISGLVPYTGATDDVLLGTHYIQFVGDDGYGNTINTTLNSGGLRFGNTSITDEWHITMDHPTDPTRLTIRPNDASTQQMSIESQLLLFPYTGQAPIVTASTVLNSNFNADLLDGYQADTLAKDTFGVTINNGPTVPTTGSKGFTTVAYDCTITEWFLVADAIGSCVIDIKRNGTSIIGAGNKPTLASDISDSSVATSWTSTSLSKGDILEFNLDSVATVKFISLIVKITK